MSFDSCALSELNHFGFKDGKEIISCLMSLDIDNAEESLKVMLDPNISRQKKFIKEFLTHMKKKAEPVDPRFYRKPDLDDTLESSFGSNAEESETTKNQMKKNKERTPKSVEKSPQNPDSGKKKTKFVSIYSPEGRSKDVILLPGRHKCDCQGSKHKLLNNCLECGRIVCAQEGSGPCYFCKNLVTSKEEKDLINKGNKKGEALLRELMSNKKIIDPECDYASLPQPLLKAIEHKNKLLEFDRTSEKRTQVYDDESDYFQSSSSWISPEKREQLIKYEDEIRRKKHEKRNTYTVDVIGRQIFEDQAEQFDYLNDKTLQNLLLQESPSHGYKKNQEALNLLDFSQLIYECSNPGFAQSDSAYRNKNPIIGDLHRIQDRELQEMRDEGMCLSMHQPWASLLVAGIKIHEGRDWYSSHRGRLWFASGSKVPTQEEISDLEDHYKIMLNDEKLKFPLNYPTSVMLGCVDIVNVLPQEEYRREYPQGESDCAYVFICENAQELMIKLPIKGKHKIYKLDRKLHEAALKSLKR